MSPLQPQPSDRSPALAVRTKSRTRAPHHLWAIGIPLILVGLVLVLFGARVWLDGFLRSPEFRHFLERKTSVLLHAQIQLEPLHWEGSEVYSDALDGVGYATSSWTRLSADQIRADLDLRALWRRIWRIDTLDFGKLNAALGPSAGRPAEAVSDVDTSEYSTPRQPGLLARLLPTRVEIGKIHVSDLSLSWGDGQPASSGELKGAELTAHQRSDDQTWEIDGRKGVLTQARLPALTLGQFTLKANSRELTIIRASAEAAGGGEVDFSGSQQLEGDKDLTLDTTFEGISSEGFLLPDWRARLKGLASGTVRITGSPALANGWRANGHIDLHEGRLEALPILDELAVFTATAQFRQATLQKGSADFDWQAGALTVSNLELEAEGLIRLEGGFTVRGGQIEGAIQLGVARTAGRLLAGVGAQVFNEPERDGYLWTTVRLSGPVQNPHEDLTARLLQATQQEVVRKAQQGADTVLDTASGLLNLLKPPQ